MRTSIYSGDLFPVEYVLMQPQYIIAKQLKLICRLHLTLCPTMPAFFNWLLEKVAFGARSMFSWLNESGMSFLN